MAAKRKSPVRKAQSDSVYQLKVTLLESDPPIWRRLQVPANVTLGELHYILQATMGWTNSHLHQFRVNDTDYSDPGFGLEETENEDKVTLAQIAPRAGAAFLYQYDFGDDWMHEVTVEKVLPRKEGERHPVCLGGEHACPPEDCGGIGGYDEFLQAIRDPHHEEHQDLLEWIGGSFDSEAFDPDQANRQLKDIRRAL